MLTNARRLNEIQKQVVRGSNSCANDRQPNNSLRLREALSDLYRLLEEYAPFWYTEEYKEKAEAALQYPDKY